MSVKEQMVGLAISELPGIVALLRERFSKANPDAPPPTSEEVVAGLDAACISSLAKDAAWLAAHPQEPTQEPSS